MAEGAFDRPQQDIGNSEGRRVILGFLGSVNDNFPKQQDPNIEPNIL